MLVLRSFFCTYLKAQTLSSQCCPGAIVSYEMIALVTSILHIVWAKLDAFVKALVTTGVRHDLSVRRTEVFDVYSDFDK